MPNSYFQFQQFTIHQGQCAMKVGTDGVLLGAWAKNDLNIGQRILDIGTGTGLLALMMAQRFPNIPIDAVEIDANACLQAKKNFEDSPWHKRLYLFQEDFQTFALNYPPTYDCILSNPPYFHHSLPSPNKSRTIARHTDSLPFVVLLNGVKRLLLPHGSFNVILPYDQLPIFLLKAQLAGLYCSHQLLTKATPKKPFKRALLRFTLTKTSSQINQLIIGNGRNIPYSENYKQLTKDFYLIK